MRHILHWSVLGVLAMGLASAALAQQPAATNDSSGSQTLFDLLQSRLKATGLVPMGETEVVPPVELHRPMSGSQQATPSSAGRWPTGANPTPAVSARGGVQTPIAVARVNPNDTSARGNPSPPSATAPQSGLSGRMHQRLSTFRDSTFSGSQPQAPPRTDSLRTLQPAQSSSPPQEPVAEPSPNPQAALQRPTLAPPKEGSNASPGPSSPSNPSQLIESPIEGRIGRLAAEPKAPDQVPTPAITGSDSVAGSDSAPGSAAAPSLKPSLTPQILFTRQSPILNVKTIGPERIDVGRESTFRVTIENLGAVAADELIVAIDFPEWADLLGAEVSAGATYSEMAAEGTRMFRWKVGRLGAKDEETVVLHVVARQSQPFDLAVNWHYAPVITGAKITVLEPALKLNLEGPGEVLFGKEQIYRLELENTGTGEARGVSLALLPLGTGQTQPAIQPIGVLPAGGKKAIEVELTPRNEGDLVIQVDATAEGDVHARLSERIRVLRPALAIEVAAPEFQFVGKEVAYRINVTNPGTAIAEKILVRATLPDTVRYLSATGEGLSGEEEGQLRWEIPQLAPQESRTLLVECEARAAGTGRMTVVSGAADGLEASADAAVEIEAIADLALKITDPSGPIEVGSEAEYTLTVQNRGSKEADDVEVVAYFSNGIEPTAAAGGTHRIGPGQVVFDLIKVIGPGETHTLVITARAESTGTHIVRAEVSCRPLGTRLVAEESTYFYLRRAASPGGDPSPRSSGERGVLTADRRDSEPANRSADSRE